LRRSENDSAEEELYRLQAEFCKGMAHPKRIQILRNLKSGEKTVSELARLTGIPQANMSQHLALLRQFGLLNTRRDGSSIYYSISDHRIVEACELVRSCIGERLKKSQLVLTVPP
jgi:ArsR family transcriptional regulator, virulence genes transcriptional regulator